MNRLRRALQGYRVLLLPVAGAVFLNLPLLFVLFWRNQQGAVLTPLKTLYLTGIVLLGLFAFYMVADSTVYGIYKFHIDFFWLDFVLHNAVGMGISPAMTPGLPFYLPFTPHKHAARYGGNLSLFAADGNTGEPSFIPLDLMESARLLS